MAEKPYTLTALPLWFKMIWKCVVLVNWYQRWNMCVAINDVDGAHYDHAHQIMTNFKQSGLMSHNLWFC